MIYQLNGIENNIENILKQNLNLILIRRKIVHRKLLINLNHLWQTQ